MGMGPRTPVIARVLSPRHFPIPRGKDRERERGVARGKQKTSSRDQKNYADGTTQPSSEALLEAFIRALRWKEREKKKDSQLITGSAHRNRQGGPTRYNNKRGNQDNSSKRGKTGWTKMGGPFVRMSDNNMAKTLSKWAFRARRP